MYCKLVHHVCDVTGDVPGTDRNDPFRWHISPKWYKISKKCDGRSIQTWGELAIANGTTVASVPVLSQVTCAKICDKILHLCQRNVYLPGWQLDYPRWRNDYFSMKAERTSVV